MRTSKFKTTVLPEAVLCILLAIAVFTGCPQKPKNGGREKNINPPEADSAGMVTVISREINFQGIKIDYPLTDSNEYYKGVFTEGRQIKIKPYKIGKYEVSYKVWKEVYDWNERENKGYKFAKGQKGVQESTDENEPVTLITWRDCIIWCNAYTEKITGSTDECVYRKSNSDSAVLKDALKTAECDAAYFDENKKGFRLPTEIEWEFAARFQYDNTGRNADNYGTLEKPIWLTKLNSLSGAVKQCGLPFAPLPPGETWETLYNEAVRVAVFNDWFDGTDYKEQEPKTEKTERVDGKAANGLGLHNMSGNVWELCWDLYKDKIDAGTGHLGALTGTNHSARGGSWIGASSGCTVGWRGKIPFFMDYECQGLRLACSL